MGMGLGLGPRRIRRRCPDWRALWAAGLLLYYPAYSYPAYGYGYGYPAYGYGYPAYSYGGYYGGYGGYYGGYSPYYGYRVARRSSIHRACAR